MVVAAILCSLFLIHGAFVEGKVKEIDTEQALFAYARCQEDHLPSGSRRTQYINNWHLWKLEPNDKITQCYAKCSLESLGLYDAKRKVFTTEIITVQHEAYKNLNGAKDSDVAEYTKAVASLKAGSGSCADVYKAYLPVHNRFSEVSRRLFHGTLEVVTKIYAANPNIKRKGESYFAYCEKRVYGESHKADLCKARQYELTGSEQLKKSIDCIFRGLRYYNDEGLNVDEIVRDFKLVNKANLESQVRSVLSGCSGTKAYDYYSCLVNSKLKEDFKTAFDYREFRSADYTYLVQGNKYDPAKVKAEVAKADAKVC